MAVDMYMMEMTLLLCTVVLMVIRGVSRALIVAGAGGRVRKSRRQFWLEAEFDALLAIALACKKVKLDFNDFIIAKVAEYMVWVMEDERRNPDYYYEAAAERVKLDMAEQRRELKKYIGTTWQNT